MSQPDQRTKAATRGRKAVKVTGGYVLGRHVDNAIVELADEEFGKRAVYLDGDLIGYVWKGTRRYSPPTHKGSRIVRYHKSVPEWQGGVERHSTHFHRDTRQEVLRDLIAGDSGQA